MKQLLLCLLLLSLPASAAFQQQLAEAQQKFSERDYEATISLLKQSIATTENPKEQAMAHNALGWTYFKQKEYELAKIHLTRALKLAEKSGDQTTATKASNNLGVLAYTTGDYERAQSQFSAAPSKQSTAASTYMSLIQQQQQIGSVNEQIATGVSFARKGQFAQAIEYYNQALDINPNHVRALEYKGYAQFRLGLSEEAIKTQTLALKIEPTRVNVLINMMKALCQLDDQQGLANFVQHYAIQIRPSKGIMQSDRELTRHCGQSFVDSL